MLVCVGWFCSVVFVYSCWQTNQQATGQDRNCFNILVGTENYLKSEEEEEEDSCVAPRFNGVAVSETWTRCATGADSVCRPVSDRVNHIAALLTLAAAVQLHV